MKTLLALCLAVLFTLSLAVPGQQPARADEFAALRARAERLEQEGSWESARSEWERAADWTLSAADARWLAYRRAECRWRSLASTRQSDDTDSQAALKALNELQAKVERPELRDETWARIEESLGDFFWTAEGRQDWGQAWPHYQAALDWWARAKDLERARARYLAMVWRMAWPRTNVHRGWGYAHYVPVQVFEDALKIAVDEADRARAEFLFAVAVQQQGGSRFQQRRAFATLASAIGRGKGTAWYDDALLMLASWHESPGEPDVDEEGRWVTRPDYVKSLALFRRYVEEFQKGQVPNWDEARNAIERLTSVQVSVSTPCAFLPGSEQGYTLGWRNTPRVELALYRLDLARHGEFAEASERSAGDWLQNLKPGELEHLQSWSHETQDAGRHEPGSAELALKTPLTAGAYLLEARAGGRSARELLLVSRTLTVVKSAGERALVWCCDALTSEPVAGATLVLQERWYDGQRWRWSTQRAISAADGTASFPTHAQGNWGELLAFAQAGERASVCSGQRPHAQEHGQPWRLYAVTDRPAYRPDDTVRWKVTARVEREGRPTTPAGAALHYAILDPRGSELAQGELKLNDFGSAWAELKLSASQALGEYQVRFSVPQNRERRHVGDATLFRLEEYKLPEFEVTLATPLDGARGSGAPRLFRLGERVEALLSARTFFGAPVAGAEAQVTVWQKPYARRWQEEREFPWCYEPDPSLRWGRWNKGQQVLNATLKTDARGELTVPFDTPEAAGQDLEYTIEARVTDASRREIASSHTLRVTSRAYDVRLKTAHQIHRPGTAVELAIEARDANERPVAAEGRLKLWRQRWIEVWRDPQGREVRGAELANARHANPALPLEQRPGWQLVRSGYEDEELASARARTDASGKGSWSFTPPGDGYYRVNWTSRDDRRQPIAAETALFVAHEGTQETGFRSGGLELIVDRDTFRQGEKAPVMISSALGARHVLVTLEGERLHAHQVVHVTGTAKLIEIDVGPELVPNAWLSALTAMHGEAFSDTEELVVPPTEQLLTVRVEPSAAQQEPGSEATLVVRAQDARGAPARAELTLSVVDQAVLALQSEYAGDPRPFFHGRRREQRVQSATTFDSRRFRRLVRDPQGRLRDERQAAQWEEDAKNEDELVEVAGEFRAAGGSKSRTFGRRGAPGAPTGGAGGAPAPQSAALESLGALKKESADFDGGARDQESWSGNPALGEAGGQDAPVQVRSDFRETALWTPDLVTDAEGRAEVRFKYPDSVTRWKFSARAHAADARVGYATGTTRTQKPLTVRLAAPRLFVVGDECVVSALLDNQTEAALAARVELTLEGLEVLAAPGLAVEVPAQGQVRLDWKVRAVSEGRARLVARARAGAASDGVERTYPVHAHGIDAQVARALRFRSGELVFDLDVPAARRKETTTFEVQVAPSLAVTMLDALPYLVDYPYGCTEQTLSRFLPAAIVAKTLKERGLSPEEAMQRVFGGIEPEMAGATHPKGKQSLEKLAEVTRLSLERLYDFQHQDGGWGWWKDGESDAWMSAYVVWGLALARDAGLDVDLARLERGARFVELELVEWEDQPDLAAWGLHALAAWSKDAGRGEHAQRAFANLWAKKGSLNAYGRALFALAAHAFGRADETRVLLDNLANGISIDTRPDGSRIEKAASTEHAAAAKTAHWGADGLWWRWSDSPVETTAFGLAALVTIDPKHALVEPVMTWLVQNRRGAQWSSTRDTAIAVLALDRYLSRSGELARDVEYEVLVNGTRVGGAKLTAKELLTAPGRYTLPPGAVRDGKNEVRVRLVGGQGPLYVSSHARFFSLEEPIPPRGSQLYVHRQYYKLESRPTLLRGQAIDKSPLADGGRVQSGDRVEVVLTIEAKNDLEYLVFEDLKPAGFEAVETKSGGYASVRELKSGEVAYRFESSAPLAAVPDPDDWARYTGRQRGVHTEFRDRQVAHFVDRLGQGVWEIRYVLRAEAPGRFHALPTLGEAMYVPEVRCNGAETRVEVFERGGT